MKKRILAIALSLALLLGLVPAGALAATDTCRMNDGGPHKWVLADETPADCQHTGTRTYSCDYCGTRKQETTPKGGHSFGKWKTTKEATCERRGEQARTCSVCGYKETRKTDRADHTWSRWTVTQEATCAETGLRERTCQVCGTVRSETIRKLPHTWGEWEIVVEATDHSSGTRSHTCQVCGAEETEAYDPEGTLHRGDEGDAVKALQQGLICYGALKGKADGDFGKKTEAAVEAVQEAEGLTADGVAWPQTQALLGHRFGAWEVVSELSDFSIGLRRRTCERCGYQETEEEWPEPTYKRGDKGDGVKSFQEKLNAAGYDCGKADGDFGKKTENAVKAIEADHGVEPDGIAWPGVQKWLTGGSDDLTEVNSTKQGNSEPEIPDDPIGAPLFIHLKNGPADLPRPQPVYRSFEVVDWSKSPYDLEQGDVVEVRLRLTIDSYDDYDLLGLDPALGDSIKHEDWMDEPLLAGESYECSYTMAIRESGSNWADRTITARLMSHSMDQEERESVTFGPIGVPANVTLEPSGGYNIINSADAYLYLLLKQDKIDTQPYSGENMDVCFGVDSYSVYGVTIRDIKLMCELCQGDTAYASCSASVADKLKSGNTIKEVVRQIPISMVKGHYSGYSLRLYLQGTYLDEKNKTQTVTSEPKTLEITPLSLDARLDLTVQVEPKKASYAMNDKVTITFTTRNNGSGPFENAHVEFAGVYAEEKDHLPPISAFSGGDMLLPDEEDTAVMEYCITADDVENGYFRCAFFAVGTHLGAGPNGPAVRSKRVDIDLPITSGQLPEKKLGLSAAMADALETYPVETSLPYTVTIKNDSGYYLSSARIYAVGDNRMEPHPEGVEWHDLGHGMKGFHCGSVGLMEPGAEATVTLYMKIPGEFASGKNFYPRWIAEGDLVNATSKLVLSDPADLALAVGSGAPDTSTAPSIDLQLTGYDPYTPTQKLNSTVAIDAEIKCTGDVDQEALKAWYTTKAHPDLPQYGEITGMSESAVQVRFEAPIDEANIVDGDWAALFHAAVEGTELYAETPDALTFHVDLTGADAPEEATGLSLSVKQLTSAPDVVWKDQAQCQLQISATCFGEAMPNLIQVMMFDDADTEAGTLVSETTDAYTLDNTYTLTLDASHATGNVLHAEFVAFAYLDDVPGSDLTSDPRTLSFPMEGYEGEGEGQKKPGIQINWDAIHDFQQVVDEAENGNGQEAGTDGAKDPTAPGEDPAQQPAPGEGDPNAPEGPGGEQPEQPGGGEKTEQPEQPGDGEKTEQPEQPGDGEKTEQPEQPGDGEKTEQPEQPGGGEKTEQPEQPGGGEKTEQPEQPGGGEKTEQPEQPDGGGEKMEQPEQPGSGEKTEQPNKPDGGEKKNDKNTASDREGRKASPDGNTGHEAENALPAACTLRLTGQAEGYAEYALAFCPEHAALARETIALLENPDDAGAWRQAAALWREALNAEYDALAAPFQQGEAELVEADRAARFAQLDALHAAVLASRGEQASEMALTEAMILECALLCEMRHTAPERPGFLSLHANALQEENGAGGLGLRDLMLTESGALLRETLPAGLYQADAAARASAEGASILLTALDDAARKACDAAGEDASEAVADLWLAGRQAISARKALLEILYPEDDMAREVLLYQIRSCALDLCLLAQAN